MSDPKPQEKRRTDSSASPPLPAENSKALVFKELARGSKEVLIEHHGQVYRLRATRNGGLILNK